MAVLYKHEYNHLPDLWKENTINIQVNEYGREERVKSGTGGHKRAENMGECAGHLNESHI